MKTTKTIEEITCDSCGKIISDEKNENFVTIDNQCLDLCHDCLCRLKIALDWKSYKDKKVSLNFNSDIEATLGADGADAYNEYWGRLGVSPKTKGTVWETQLHNYCTTMSSAFEKMRGSYQGVAYPFEIRMKLEDLKMEIK